MENRERYNSFADKTFFNENTFMKQHQWMLLKRDTVKFFIENDYTHIFGDNFLVPNEQSSGDIIVFPSWVWHEVLPNKSNEERIVISGNISVTYYDDFN